MLDTCPKCGHDEAHDGGCWTPGCDCDWDQTTVTREATVTRAADALWDSDAGVMLHSRRQCEDIARVVLAATRNASGWGVADRAMPSSAISASANACCGATFPVSARCAAASSAPRQFASQEAAAQRWDVSVDTIRRLIARGKITGYRLNNRIIRVDLDEVDACFRPIPTMGGAA